MAKLAVKVEKITKVVDRKVLIDKVLSTVDFVENIEGRKYTVRKCIENMKEIDLTYNDGKIRFSMGNTDGYVINLNGLYELVQSEMTDEIKEGMDYITVVIGFKN